MSRFWLLAGCATGFLSVASGAFGAHALKDHLSPEMLNVFETAVRYSMLHCSALLAVGLVGHRGEARAIKVAGIAFIAGIVLFSGSLVGLALTEVRALGIITPFGGLSFLTGWVALGLAVARGSDPA